MSADGWGRVEYHAEDLGLDKDDLRRRFAPYVKRFVTPPGASSKDAEDRH
ncbi:hypothetical protein [Mycobacterium sp.]